MSELRFSKSTIEWMNTTVVDAGWNPFDPSPEWATKNAARPELARLSDMDRRGVHWTLIVLRAFSALLRGKEWTDDRGEALMFGSAVWLLILERGKDGLTVEDVDALSIQINEWREKRLHPANERLDAAFEAHGGDYVMAHGAEFEPAFTLALCQKDLGLADFDGDLRRFNKAMAFHDAGRRESRTGNDYDFSYLAEMFPILTANGETVGEIDDRGRFILTVTAAKARLDHLFGRRDPRKMKREVLLADVPEVVAPPDDVVPKDAVEFVRALIRQRAEAAKPRTMRRFVIENVIPLRDGSMRTEDVASRFRVTDRAVRRELQHQVEELARRVRGKI